MLSLFTFQKKYFILALILFVTEVLIAVYAHDSFVRPYVGDYLVVMLMYCFLKSFLNLPVKKLALFVLIFSYAIEVLQYFHFVKYIGLQQSKLANIVMGNSFEWGDIIAYTLGIATIIFLERLHLLKPAKDAH